MVNQVVRKQENVELIWITKKYCGRVLNWIELAQVDSQDGFYKHWNEPSGSTEAGDFGTDWVRTCIVCPKMFPRCSSVNVEYVLLSQACTSVYLIKLTDRQMSASKGESRLLLVQKMNNLDPLGEHCVPPCYWSSQMSLWRLLERQAREGTQKHFAVFDRVAKKLCLSRPSFPRRSKFGFEKEISINSVPNLIPSMPMSAVCVFFFWGGGGGKLKPSLFSMS
jgi:hypothetical protein